MPKMKSMEGVSEELADIDAKNEEGGGVENHWRKIDANFFQSC